MPPKRRVEQDTVERGKPLTDAHRKFNNDYVGTLESNIVIREGKQTYP